MSRQLILDLPPLENFTRAGLIVTPANRLALAALDGWQGWPGGKMVLAGPSGAGKTHLARIWAADSGATVVSATALDDPDRLARHGAVAVEDADRIAGEPAAERALFHLHNLLLPAGRLLVTAATPPRDWGLGLPDLLSRMQAAPLTRLEAPDDTLLHGVLTKLFSDRQIAPPPGLISYLLTRMPRSIGAARAVVAELDARALAEGRTVGLRLAAEILHDTPDD
ncbi:chromosomal replication initiator DnaA [Neotabrizicola sp. VNH66]|uniref:chromosomal replication initiator DnaA n=1 Tax=Neotabrizicola sp. VNH66 TaxID=3400918 RepID=UPI003BFBAF90